MAIQIDTRQKVKDLDSRIGKLQGAWLAETGDHKEARRRAAEQVAQAEGCTREDLEKELGTARNALFPRKDRADMPGQAEKRDFAQLAFSTSQTRTSQGRRMLQALMNLPKENGVPIAGIKMNGPGGALNDVRREVNRRARASAGDSVRVRTSIRGDGLWIWAEPANPEPEPDEVLPPGPPEPPVRCDATEPTRDGIVDVLCKAIKGGANPADVWALANQSERQEIFEAIAELVAPK